MHLEVREQGGERHVIRMRRGVVEQWETMDVF